MVAMLKENDKWIKVGYMLTTYGYLCPCDILWPNLMIYLLTNFILAFLPLFTEHLLVIMYKKQRTPRSEYKFPHKQEDSTQCYPHNVHIRHPASITSLRCSEDAPCFVRQSASCSFNSTLQC